MIKLDGHSLTLEDLKKVCAGNEKVEIADSALKRLKDGRDLVFKLVDADFPIYGFNVGVGWDKDKKVFKDFFEQYNRDMIYAHCVGIPPYASIEETRATMLLRVNTMLFGCTGVAPEIPVIIADMLNLGIHPLLPERGSVGVADLGNLAHIGLAIIGEADVNYKGEVIKSAEAFKRAKLAPVTLGPKDGLAIISSNAFGAGQSAVALYKLEELMKKAELLFTMSLEGFNGNVSPFDKRNQALRGYKQQEECAARILSYLEGSFLFEADKDRPLQDPLCYRDVSQIYGALWSAFHHTKKLLENQFNATEDNPCLILEEETIVPSANFDPLTWVLGVEMLCIALSHVSKAACLRLIRIVNPDFTKLPRYLSPKDECQGFGIMQMTFTSLDTEIRNLCNPSSMEIFPLAGDIEDKGTNSPYIAQKLRQIIDNLHYILGIEAIHAAQALGFRKGKQFGRVSGKVYKAIIEVIPFYEKDSNLTKIILDGYNFVKSDNLLNI